MKYYCKNCGSEIKTNVEAMRTLLNRAYEIMIFHSGRCDINPMINGSGYEEHCVEYRAVVRDIEVMLQKPELIPDYETPEQYEKRTGKAYPDHGMVWRFSKVHWFPCEYSWIKGEAKLGRVYTVVIADPPVPPPDGWRPDNE